jgi:hypothetical protein
MTAGRALGYVLDVIQLSDLTPPVMLLDLSGLL